MKKKVIIQKSFTLLLIISIIFSSIMLNTQKNAIIDTIEKEPFYSRTIFSQSYTSNTPSMYTETLKKNQINESFFFSKDSIYKNQLPIYDGVEITLQIPDFFQFQGIRLFAHDNTSNFISIKIINYALLISNVKEEISTNFTDTNIIKIVILPNVIVINRDSFHPLFANFLTLDSLEIMQNSQICSLEIDSLFLKSNYSQNFISISQVLLSNVNNLINFLDENGTFGIGEDAYGSSGSLLEIASMNLIKFHWAFKIVRYPELLDYCDLIIDNLIEQNTFSGSLINLARRLTGLIYVAINDNENNFPDLKTYLDEFFFDLDFDNITHCIKEPNRYEIINMQTQFETITYIWAKFRDNTTLIDHYHDFIENYLFTNQKSDGSWNYFILSEPENPKEPHNLVYNQHIMFDFAMIKFFFPEDPIFALPQFSGNFTAFFNYIAGSLPSFSYYTDYYLYLQWDLNANYEEEIHHVISYAALELFQPNLHTDLGIIFDSMSLTDPNFLYQVYNQNMLTDALSYRLFVLQDFQFKTFPYLKFEESFHPEILQNPETFLH